MAPTSGQRRVQECAGVELLFFQRWGLLFVGVVLLAKLHKVETDFVINHGIVPRCNGVTVHLKNAFDSEGKKSYHQIAFKFKAKPNNGMVGDPKCGAFSCVSSCVGE